jgi:replicative superfamily II helicase
MGYIDKMLASVLSPIFDRSGAPANGFVRELTGGYGDCPNRGVVIEFTVPEPQVDAGVIPENHRQPDVLNSNTSNDKAQNIQGPGSDQPIKSPDVDDIARIPTKGYPFPYRFSYFNLVQSLVYHHKDSFNNMIVAANTSAGKTVATELLIDTTLHRGLKIIYLSPFKALTEEKYGDWRKRYPEERLMIMTGDYELGDDVYQKAHTSSIIVMTSEMMDNRTRKFHLEKNDWMEDTGLVIVDDFHILSGSRGDKVETGIMRFTLHCPEARILFLSATMSNVEELGDWLTSLNGKRTDKIQMNYRPVILQMHYPEYSDVLNGRGHADYRQTEKRKIEIAIDRVLSKPDENS